MTINIEASNGVCHARVMGEMTIYHAAEMMGELLPCLNSCNEMEINLSEVSEIDTAGYQLLLLIVRDAASAGKLLRFVAHSAATLAVLDLLGMTSDFGAAVAMPSAANC